MVNPNSLAIVFLLIVHLISDPRFFSLSRIPNPRIFGNCIDDLNVTHPLALLARSLARILVAHKVGSSCEITKADGAFVLR